MLFVYSSCCVDVLYQLFIIVSTYHRHHVASETGFKQDSPNTDSNSLIECTFFTESRLGLTLYLKPDSLIEYHLNILSLLICLKMVS